MNHDTIFNESSSLLRPTLSKSSKVLLPKSLNSCLMFVSD